MLIPASAQGRLLQTALSHCQHVYRTRTTHEDSSQIVCMAASQCCVEALRQRPSLNKPTLKKLVGGQLAGTAVATQHTVLVHRTRHAK
jgi:hypothetical protein